jgi:hypothetical protein
MQKCEPVTWQPQEDFKRAFNVAFHLLRKEKEV